MSGEEALHEVVLDDYVEQPDKLLHFAKELQTAWIQAEDEVQNLETELVQTTKKRGGGGNMGSDRAVQVLESEKNDLERRYEKDLIELNGLKDAHTDLKAQFRSAEEEAKQAKSIEKSQSESIDRLKKEMNEMIQAQRNEKSKAQQFNKQRGDAIEESRRQHQENSQLHDENSSLQDQLKALEEEKEVMKYLISNMTEDREVLENAKDEFDLAKETYQSKINTLQFELRQTNEKLFAAMDDSEQRNKIESLQTQLAEIKQSSSVAQSSRDKQIDALKDKVQALSNDTAAGQKQQEVDELKEAQESMTHLLAEMKKEHDNAISDRNQLAERLMEFENSMESRIAQGVFAEREKIRHLERNYETLQSNASEHNGKYSELEKENKELHHEVDILTEWKVVYEEGRGFQELARQQKKLNEDKRRLGVAVEQMTGKLGTVMDANGLLTQAFERLKRESGKEANFSYPEYELEADQKGENARLAAEMNELEEQITSLEGENTRLRKSLKSAAGSFGEQGFKFAGMRPEQLMKVTEFANNLRDGNLELPSGDPELIRENKKFKNHVAELENRIQTMQIEGVAAGVTMVSNSPIDGGTSAGGASVRASGGGLSKMQEMEITGLREDMKKLLLENSELRSRMVTMQDEVIGLIRNQAGHAMDHTESISSIMHTHNDSLVKELQALRGQFSNVPAATLQHHPFPSPNPHSEPPHYDMASTDTTTPAATHKAKGKGHSTHGKAHGQTKVHGHGAHFKKHNVPIIQTPGPSGGHTHEVPTPGVAMQTPYHQGVDMSFNNTAPLNFTQPSTPHGKTLLNKTLSQMNLPSEEWVEEVKELNGQLVECLEQLHERELELEEQHGITATLEDNLVAIKQQMAGLYHDFVQRTDSWETKEKDLNHNTKSLRDDNDDLKLKLKNQQDILLKIKTEDPEALEAKLVDLTRKVAVYEINETKLSRKYTSQAEMLQTEREQRQKLEAEFVDMESSLKQRILYLEQYKHSAGSRMAFLQGKLDTSVPSGDYSSIQKELDALREEHLALLRREVDARVAVLEAKEQTGLLRAVRLSNRLIQAELQTSQATSVNLSAQLEHQKDTTNRAMQSKNNTELSSIISDMATFRGEAGRLEVELASATRKAEALHGELKMVTGEADATLLRLKEMEAREEQASQREEEARKNALAVTLRYDGGLVRDEADILKKKVEKLELQLQESEMEAKKQKEMAEIATLQAQTMGTFKSTHAEEVKEMREHCSMLESRSDDDILIGRLQRQLMSMKSSYKAFVQKYQMLRGGMRQREMAVRLLEARVDQREEAVSSLQEAHRIEVGALKKALRNVQNTTEGDAFLSQSNAASAKAKKAAEEGKKSIAPSAPMVSVGHKLILMSDKVKSLSILADGAITKASAAEEESMVLEGQVQDLQAELDNYSHRCRDLELSIEKGGKAKTQSVAARLVSLSEEVRVNKLCTLQQRRQIQVLRQEKRHLQSMLQQTEADVESLEVGKVYSETRGLLEDYTGDEPSMRSSNTSLAGLATDKLGANINVKIDSSLDMPERENILPAVNVNKGKNKKSGLSIKVTDSADFGPENSGVSASELLSKLEAANGELNNARRDASAHKLQSDKFRSLSDELDAALKEKDSQIAYYERMAQQEGLPAMNIRGGASASASATNNAASTRQLQAMKQEQGKIQEAASATIQSLKSLLDEKNRLIEGYRQRMEEMQANGEGKRTRSKADRKADELLEQLDADEKRGGSKGIAGSLGIVGIDGAGSSEANQKLLQQIEQADEILMEKDRTIGQLETKLGQQHNQRERAEIRVGTSLKEMEAMKADMITLAQQLQLSEDRLRRATGKPTSSAANTSVIAAEEKKIMELTKALRGKDEKIKGYRDIIIRLKEEFIKAEEEKALANLANNTSHSTKGGMATTGASMVGGAELKALKDQISALRDGLRQAKEDLEKARKTREKLSSARQAAMDEASRFEQQIGHSEAAAATAQNALNKTRSDLEESRRKEFRLRDKLKELLETDGGADKLRDLKGATERGDTLQKECEVLRAQNLALRRAAEEASQNIGNVRVGAKRSVSSIDKGDSDNNRGKSSSAATAGPDHQFGTGNTLGDAGGAPQDELRAQLHSKWESEKKLQKRLAVMEKRLHEKVEETEELTQQLKRARDMAQQAIQAKEDMAKHAKNSAKNADDSDNRRGGRGEKKGSSNMDDVAGLEAAQAKAFELEEALNKMRRKADVEQANEIAKLRHELSVLQVRTGELEAELEESEVRRKQAASGVGGGRSLRDSEDRFLREERLKDDLEVAKRQKLQLEADMLDRDARAIEARFDLESNEADSDRLKRRVRELENAYRAAAASGGSKTSVRGVGTSGLGGDKNTGGGASRREGELEGTIEAMKRVVDKLKAENDRLRKGTGGEDGKSADTSKKLAAEKKRADKLEEDFAGLKAKLRGHEESSQKLVQRQQQLASMRKQLKVKEDELAMIKESAGSSSEEVDALKRKLKTYEGRISQLESTVQQTSARGNKDSSNAGALEKEVSELRRRATNQATDIERLRSDLAEAQKQSKGQGSGPGQTFPNRTGGGGGDLNAPANASEVKRLQGENDKLRQELAAFDMDFFEEIENLKYSHAEAMKKLRVYESSAAEGRRR